MMNKMNYNSQNAKYVGICICVIIYIVFSKYKPVRYFEVEPDYVKFDKWGGKDQFYLKSNVNSSDLIYKTDNSDFYELLDINVNVGINRLKVGPNINDRRTAIISVDAVSTLFGHDVGRIKNIHVFVEQESGLPTDLIIEPLTQSGFKSTYTTENHSNGYKGVIRCESFHHTVHSFRITTDGVRDLDVQSDADWIKIKKESDNEYLFYVEENKSIRREGTVTIKTGIHMNGDIIKQLKESDIKELPISIDNFGFSFSENDFEKKIKIVQPSGKATFINVQYDNILLSRTGVWPEEIVDKEGGKVKRFDDSEDWDYITFNAYFVKVECDGYWDLEQVPDWLFARIKDGYLELFAQPNEELRERSTTLKIKASGMVRYLKITQQGKK